MNTPIYIRRFQLLLTPFAVDEAENAHGIIIFQFIGEPFGEIVLVTYGTRKLKTDSLFA